MAPSLRPGEAAITAGHRRHVHLLAFLSLRVLHAARAGLSAFRRFPT